MDGIGIIIAAVVALVIGAGAGIAYGLSAGARRGAEALKREQEVQGSSRLAEAQREAELIRARVQQEAAEKSRNAEAESKRVLEESTATANRRRADLDKEDERLRRSREDVDKRLEKLEVREQNLNKRQARMDKDQADLELLQEQRNAELQRIAGMSMEDAKAELVQAAEVEARSDMARIIRQVEAQAHEEADERAREVISLAVQRLASEHVNEISVSVVNLPSDEMKGRIIGRNGRNIRAFEMAAGVDVVVDDTPESVTISSFDPIRREIAKRALAKLVLDGRIHPARIEKLIEDAHGEVDSIIRTEGERAAYEANVPGLHPEILKLLGRLKFRSSYGQNMHAHAIETAHIAGMIAAELGGDVMVAKAGGLLHDLGKAIDHEVEGTHAMIGAEVARRYGVHPRVVNAIASHHHEVEQEFVESYIVEAADAISGARPGARRESLESYVRRVRTLEEIANSFDGVEQSYALQAGREVRIIVRPEQIDDLRAVQLSKDVARKIEETMQYPGTIKVQVIRELRATDTAR